MVTPVETTTAGWPGSKPAANGHLLGAVMGSEVRVQGLDGIAEVLFDPPESQPSNTHSSEEQSRDELEFVTAMTAVPIVEPVHHFAPYSVWIVSVPSSAPTGSRWREHPRCRRSAATTTSRS
jgi:hypothetical protein